MLESRVREPLQNQLFAPHSEWLGVVIVVSYRLLEVVLTMAWPRVL